MTCILPTQGDSQTTFRISWPTLHPSAASAYGLGQNQQTPRYLTSYQLFMSDHPELGTPCHNDLSGDCNLFFQIEGRKKWTLIDPRFTLMIYPVIPPNPLTGKA